MLNFGLLASDKIYQDGTGQCSNCLKMYPIYRFKATGLPIALKPNCNCKVEKMDEVHRRCSKDKRRTHNDYR